ncbi:adenosylcobinamide-GDP ribazoletransferase [Pseudobacillus wudalianchiensis]|uniref:Adenosylcobinamide-GDP ribazoletransferase n=1 Tax=Pseudobacillus wudalianchiensis TaxID=1743143 RepID=A0A1B9AG32_9BACI|nr:adenosylcobinamide-GDP ribazoletransferase [Bacillus wudalianchiensis]OCA82798.1 cobalamin 5'-phosphate synthase [Bacillus wudalianchiensis]
MQLKMYVNGFLLNVQFFSAVPIHKELPVDPHHLRAALRVFPLFGLVKGLIYGSVFWMLLEWSPLSSLGNAFLFWLLLIIWTGGLHLDGWIDTSDAFFSYRDINRRLEILKDPRVGAFGVLSLIVLLASRFLFIYEIFLFGDSALALLIVLLPFYSQLMTGLSLNSVKPAKQEGIAYFFQQGKDARLVVYYGFWLMGSGLLFFFISGSLFLFLILTMIAVWFFWFARWGALKHFGGITGDILGASLEGAELLLWMTLWLLVSIGMA